MVPAVHRLATTLCMSRKTPSYEVVSESAPNRGSASLDELLRFERLMSELSATFINQFVVTVHGFFMHARFIMNAQPHRGLQKQVPVHGHKFSQHRYLV